MWKGDQLIFFKYPPEANANNPFRGILTKIDERYGNKITQFLFSDSTFDSSLEATARDPENPEHFEQGDAQLHKIGPTDQVRRVDVLYEKEDGWSCGLRKFDKDGKQLLIFGEN